ncbi:MAG: TonB-dependent receptor, partial [Sphingobacteriaceae bacterium]
ENPYAISNEFINKRNRNSITGNVQVNYNIVNGLNLQLRTAVDMGYDQREQDRPYDAGSKLVKGSYRAQNIYSQEITNDFLLRYNRKVTKNFDLTFTAGGSTLTNTYNKDEVRADSLTYPGIYSAANAAGPLVSLPYKTKYKLNSFYGLFSAAYKNYLYLDLTGRKDWVSTLATPFRTENSGFFYPSASASFVLSDFTKLPSQISFAKLRASIAGVGSGSTNPYLTSYNYTTAGNGLYPGGALQNPSTLANPNLKPLKTTTYEIGTDIRLFNNRFGFDLTLYTGNTKNQILNRIVDRASGTNVVVTNIGRVNNQGIELAVNGTPFRSSKNGFGWSLYGTFTANRNKIIELGDSSVILRNSPVAGGQIVAKVGGSMGDLYGRG